MSGRQVLSACGKIGIINLDEAKGYRLHDDVLYGVLQFLSLISRHSAAGSIQIKKN